VVGVQVRKAIPGKEAADPETSIELLVRQPGKRVVGVSGITITSFTDDKNTDLAKDQVFGKKMGDPTRYNDGSQMTFPLRSGILPAKGATKLRAKGSVTVRVGTDLTCLERKDVAIKDDSTVKVGPFELRRLKDADNGQTEVLIAYAGNIVKKIEFLDKDGSVVSSRCYCTTSFGGSYSDQYELAGKLDRFGVRISYFAKSETVVVPLDLEAGLGF
jgi:hypothetical protein